MRFAHRFRSPIRRVLLASYLLVTTSLYARSARPNEIDYPATRRVEHVDVYHGVEVLDPYRWLEEDVRTSEEVAAWVKAQNTVTRAYLDALPGRAQISQRLTELWDYERYGIPQQVGGHLFFSRNDGLQDQSVLWVQEELQAKPRMLLDPNTWSEDGTVALGGYDPSEDGRYVAYAVTEAGSDWRTWQVMEIDSGRVLDERIRWTKTWGVSWTQDSRGFFYSRYPTPGEGQQFQAANFHEKIYYHRVGTPQQSDVLVYERPDHPEWNLDGVVTEDGRYLVIIVSKGTDRRYRVLYRDLSEPYAAPIELVDNFDHEYTFVGNDGPLFYFRSDRDAPRKRVVAIDVRAARDQQRVTPERVVIPEQDETLTGIDFVGNLLAAQYLKDARSLVKLFDTRGHLIREVELPGLGTASGFSGRRQDTETFYSFASFATPPTIYRYDTISGRSQVFRQAEVDFDPSEYIVRQVFYASKDGTRIPMFLAHRRDVQMDGQRPTLLYGYGGFAISITPFFSPARVQWMEMGGVLAVANLRGGGEYGETWHQAGTKLKKQNVFDDFIAAAEYLVREGHTSRERLAIEGRSNGGLLVGAVMTQRPDLFGACLPYVGVMDMLRFHQFTAGRYWVDDYGSADNPEEFHALLAYSPYHNIDRQQYPPTLILTADTDDRVVPGHSFKFGAALQRAHTSDVPILLRIESRAGHGAGTPTRKRIEEVTDVHAFLAKHLGVENGGGD